MEADKLPQKTVERLSQYRRVLKKVLEMDKEYIYSHELAKLMHVTAVQVRRDIMLIGHNGTLRKGYKITDLIDLISTIIDSGEPQRVCIVGIGNLGQALLKYITTDKTTLQPVAIFDTSESKVGKKFRTIQCYHEDKIEEVVKQHQISIAILTCPPEFAQNLANRLVNAGVRGIINYTPAILFIQDAYLEHYDMITSLEKVAYFSKPKFHL